MPYTAPAYERPIAQGVGMGISELFENSAHVPHALIVAAPAGAPAISTTANKYVLLGGDYAIAGGGTVVIDCSTECLALLGAVTTPDTAGAGAIHSTVIAGTNVTITGVGLETGWIFILGTPVAAL